MKIHIGNEKTLMTRCGMSIKRVWWVPDTTSRVGKGPGSMIVKEKLYPANEASCTECIAKMVRK